MGVPAAQDCSAAVLLLATSVAGFLLGQECAIWWLISIALVLCLSAALLFVVSEENACAVSAPPSPTSPPARGLPNSLPSGARAFCCKWRVVRTHNYDAYLSKLGVPWALRKLISTLKPSPRYFVEHGVLHAITPGIGGFSRMHDVFSIGAEKKITFAGFKAVVVYTWERDGGTDVLVARVRLAGDDGSEPVSIRRWVDDGTGQLVAQSTAAGVTYTRWYEAVAETEPPSPSRLSSSPRSPTKSRRATM